MSPENFIEAVRSVVFESAATGTIETIENPPGRRPSEALVRRSEWFRSLGEDDRAQVAAVARGAADFAVFNFLCVLDGVAAIEGPGPKGDIRLTYVSPNGESNALNEPGTELHDLYRSVVDPFG